MVFTRSIRHMRMMHTAVKLFQKWYDSWMLEPLHIEEALVTILVNSEQVFSFVYHK